MGEPASHLRLIDPDTGELTEAACPTCKDRAFQLDELTRKYHGVLAQLGKMRADKTAEAKAHKWWGLAISLFQDWKMVTGHYRSGWTAERFWLCQPFLESDGYATCRFAVWGLAACPNVKRITDDYQEVYDDWELCFRTRATFERYANRGKAIFGNDLPLTDLDQLLVVHRRRAGLKRL